MRHDSSLPVSPSGVLAGETGLTQVLADTMLGAASAVHGAIALAIADESGAMDRDSLLELAIHRLDCLTEQLRDLATCVPARSLPVVDPARQQGESIVEDGTQVALYSAFNGTWCAGFEIASAAAVGYRVRRLSDGSLLPGFTSRSDLRVLDRRELGHDRQ